MYHRFEDQRFPSTSISSKNFQEQIKYLRENNFNILPISDLILFFKKSYEIPNKSVFITIDDGYKSFYEHAFPILKNKAQSIICYHPSLIFDVLLHLCNRFEYQLNHL